MFNKKKKAAAEAEQARQEQVASLQAQLDEVSAERAALEARITTLGETNEQLDRRLAALDQGVQSMGEQLVTLSTSNADTNRRVQAIDDHIGAADLRAEALGSELEAINQRLQAFDPAPSTAPPPPPDTATTRSDVPPPPGHDAAVPPPPAPLGIDTTDDLDERIAELRDRLDGLVDQTSSIDARVTSVSLELANQLTELSTDIDELNRSGAVSGGVDTAQLEASIAERLDAAMDDVLDSTERLAAEQARYEIQFRADLAELADRIRRPGTS